MAAGFQQIVLPNSNGRCLRVLENFLVYWKMVNQGLAAEQWKIHCICLAPNCPSRNPIKDIWLQAKTWVRRFSGLIPSFSYLKWIFEWFIRHTTFDFTTLQMYRACSKLK